MNVDMLIAVVAVLVGLVITLSVVIMRMTDNSKRLNREIDWFTHTYLVRSGWNHLFGNYYLMSFDGGKNWYQMEHQEDDGLVVKGPADAKLLAHLKGRDALLAHVSSHGPITDFNDESLQLLSDAGFVVTTKSDNDM